MSSKVTILPNQPILSPLSPPPPPQQKEKEVKTQTNVDYQYETYGGTKSVLGGNHSRDENESAKTVLKSGGQGGVMSSFILKTVLYGLVLFILILAICLTIYSIYLGFHSKQRNTRRHRRYIMCAIILCIIGMIIRMTANALL
jgi:hypothetical protein